MTKAKKTVYIVVAICGIIYASLIPMASSGYGYMGYSGYNSGPSFFYWGGPTIYRDREVRHGSLSGTNMRGGGPGSGK